MAVPNSAFAVGLGLSIRNIADDDGTATTDVKVASRAAARGSVRVRIGDPPEENVPDDHDTVVVTP